MRKLFFIVLVIALVSCKRKGDNEKVCPDYNCSDFTYQEQAQAKYNEDPNCHKDLDADKDGIPCESLPYQNPVSHNPADTTTYTPVQDSGKITFYYPNGTLWQSTAGTPADSGSYVYISMGIPNTNSFSIAIPKNTTGEHVFPTSTVVSDHFRWYINTTMYRPKSDQFNFIIHKNIQGHIIASFWGVVEESSTFTFYSGRMDLTY